MNVPCIAAAQLFPRLISVRAGGARLFPCIALPHLLDEDKRLRSIKTPAVCQAFYVFLAPKWRKISLLKGTC